MSTRIDDTKGLFPTALEWETSPLLAEAASRFGAVLGAEVMK